ncbi:MAG TPA: efflux RND transporter permease subunit [Chloroflexota bacterium]|nr:efflux RND transporter permease subunit [Chloroflexota bacterium]
MRVTQFAIRNPLVVTAVAFVLGVFGLFSYATMGVAITPNVNFPSVLVTTVYPGADAETVEANVTRPIEDAIATLPNIDNNGLTSTSSEGVSTVLVQFTTAANADLVSVDVERVVNSARSKLPAEVDPPTVTKIDINAFGVATVVLSGNQPLTTLEGFAEDVVQRKFDSLPGVSATNIRSGIVREVHVLVDEGRLQASGLSINNVINAIQAQQLEMPAGTVTQGGRDFSVYFDALVTDPKQLGDIVVLQTQAGPIRLQDVATIQDTYQKRDTIVRVNGEEGIALVVAKLPQANTITVVDEVKQAIAEMEPQLPPNTHLNVVVDSSTYTSKSFHTVQRALLEAVICTGLILLLFLHTWRSTFIVLVAIPISLLTTMVVMGRLNYNLNLLTMMALTLSVGILVDDSIVVLENIFRHLKMGKLSERAALDGRSEIGLAALTITFVDVVVYVPIAVMLSGVPAQFIQPFALTIAIATLASLLVSFTLTPLLASRFLRLEDEEAARGPMARFGRMWDGAFRFVEGRYAALLHHTLPHRWLVIIAGFGTFAAGLALPMLGFIGNDFFPSGDQSEIDITMTLPSGTSLATTNAATLDVERELLSHPEVRTVFSIVGRTSTGFGGDTGSNASQITALLVPPGERSRPSSEIGNELRRIFTSTIPAAKIQIGLPNAFGFGGFGGQPIQAQVQGSDPTTLDQFAAEVQRAIENTPGATSVQSSYDNRQTQIRAKVDWRRAADLGVSPQNAGLALRTAIDGFKSNSSQFHREGLSAIDIRVLSATGEKATLADISALPVSTANNGIVRLDQFATLQQREIPSAIRHVNRLRAITIGAEPAQGMLVGDVQKAVLRSVQALPAPPNTAVTFAGQGQQGSTAFDDIIHALGVAVMLMYMLMMMLFGSLTLPLAVIMSLPLAAVGALGAMALTRTPFTIFSLLGLAVLLGLVGKNAILLVDYTEILRARGRSRTEALLEAGPTRLRPILMTTLSVMAALLPIASGLEEGSELLKSAAVVLIGGLLTSTLLTLVFVPAMYTIFDDLQMRVRRITRRKPSGQGPTPTDAERTEREEPERREPAGAGVMVPSGRDG